MIAHNAFFQIAMGLVVILGAIRTMHMFRGRAMRALAARWGFRYVGPPAPPKWWWNPRHLKISPPLPSWIAHFHPSGQRMRQIWNVIEGQQNGVQLLIFDSVIGEYKGAPLHFSGLPNRTESIRDSCLFGSGSSITWMDHPLWGLVPLVFVVHGHREDR